MRQLYAHDANESNRRLVEDGMSPAFTNTRTARGFSIVYHVFARKQCILCSALRHKVTLHYLKLHRFEIHSALKVLSGTSLLGFRREAASSLAKTVKLKAFICKEGERKTKDFVVFYYIRHQIAAYASISKHFSYLAIFWYFNYTNFVMIKFILRRRDEGIYITAFSQASMPSMNFWGLFEMFQSKWVYLTIIHRSGGGEAAR